jgi:hypothetical protein
LNRTGRSALVEEIAETAMRLRHFALFLAFIAILPANAATKQEKIHELIEVTDVAHQMEKALDSLWPLIMERGKQANPDIPQDLWDQVQVIGREEFSKSLPEVLAQFERMYDIGFTEAEVEALLAFYKTPTGQSVMHKLNEMAPQVAALGQAWGAQVSKQVLTRLSEETQKKGYKLRL